MNKSQRSKNTGFTLVELLVVIAIMAILLTLLTPALMRAREHAKSAVCITNVKSLQYATTQYFLDNEKGFDYDYTMAEYDLYLNELSEYTDNVDECRYCPSSLVNKDSDASGQWGSASRPWCWTAGTSESEQGSYGINGWLYTDLAGIIEAWFPGASQLFVNTQNKVDLIGADEIPGFTDSTWVDAWPRNDNYSQDVVPANYDMSGESGWFYGVPNQMLRYITDRHGGQTNISFMDGHVQNVFVYEMWSFRWNADFQTESIKYRTDGSDIYQ